MVRVEQEQTGTFNEGIELENGTVQDVTASESRGFEYADGTTNLFSTIV